MKRIYIILLLLSFAYLLPAQQLPNLPIPIGAGTAEVWNDNIYLFGGSNNWSGTIVYPRIYRFDGSSWVHHDTIPDNNLWDAESVLDGDFVYLIGGWPAGPSKLRRYNLNNGQWTNLSNSPNVSQTWGLTAEVINDNIYLFNSSGNVYEYNIPGDTWVTKSSITAPASWGLSSILYNNEIYVIGWNDSSFYKYTPATDQWTRLANSLYQVGACAVGDINNLIYCIGGNINGATGAAYNTVIVYNIITDSWEEDALKISSKRHWMSTARYKGGLYVVGGIDSVAQSVDNVEQIVPQGTAGVDDEFQPNRFYLSKNYTNPFNTATTIKFEVPSYGNVTLKVFNLLGIEEATLINEAKSVGQYEISFNGSNLPSGVYFYQLKTNTNLQTRKMILLK